ncbi:cryptic autophosphorylating protein tyrosine kinase Etk [bacterium BMS3Bbin06]|nr:cryptic autophosphorylating protein tyrosine kinase Etk [bacterium BMS3Bbin06]
MTRTENYLRELYSIFFAQKRTIFGITLLIFVCSILIAFFWPPTYSATGTFLVRGKKVVTSPGSLEEVQKTVFPVQKEDLFSEVQVLTSNDVIEKTVKELKKKNKNLYPASSNLTREIYKIKKRIKTEVLPASNVIKISFYSKKPKESVTVLETLMNQYIDYRLEIANPSQAQTFFARQAEKFKKGLEAKEDELIKLVRDTGVPEPLKEIANNLRIKEALEKQLNILMSDFIGKKRLVTHLSKEVAKNKVQYFSFIEGSKTITELGLSLQKLVIEYGKVLRTYLPGSERAEAIEQQIKKTFQSLRAEAKAYNDEQFSQLLAAKDKIENLEKRIKALDDRNVMLQNQSIYQQRIEREIKLLQFSYETFSKRREEAGVNRAVQETNFSTNVSVLSKAFPSDGPVFPKKRIVIPLGLLVGFITGCSLGFIREYFDHTFKKPSDVARYADLPVVFSIPKWDNKQLRGIAEGLIIILIPALLLGVLQFQPEPVKSFLKTLRASGDVSATDTGTIKKPQREVPLKLKDVSRKVKQRHADSQFLENIPVLKTDVSFRKAEAEASGLSADNNVMADSSAAVAGREFYTIQQVSRNKNPGFLERLKGQVSELFPTTGKAEKRTGLLGYLKMIVKAGYPSGLLLDFMEFQPEPVKSFLKTLRASGDVSATDTKTVKKPQREVPLKLKDASRKVKERHVDNRKAEAETSGLSADDNDMADSSAAIADREFYTIQVSRNKNLSLLERLKGQVSALLSLPVSIEKRGSFFILNTGKAGKRTELLGYLKMILKAGYPSAMIIKGFTDREIILSDNNPPLTQS